MIDAASLLAGFDNTYGRQHLFASADVGRVVYPQYSLYDYTQQDVRVGLKSELPSNINTEVVALRTQQLAPQANLTTIQRNVITTDAVKAAGYFPLAVDWHAVVSGNASWLRNSNVIDQPTDLNTSEVDVGVRYQTGKQNYVDLLARSALATYPDGGQTVLGVNDYRDRGADLRTQWQFSGASTLQGHIGYVKRTNETLTYLNFSAPSYDLTYLWTPFSKSSLTMVLLRTVGAIEGNGYLMAVNHTYRVTPAYLPTDNIRLEAHVEWSGVNYYGNVQAQPSTTSRTDSDTSIGLAAIWTPARWLKVKIDAHREQRSSNQAMWDYADRVSTLAMEAKF
jgi:hypothetical protein